LILTGVAADSSFNQVNDIGEPGTAIAHRQLDWLTPSKNPTFDVNAFFTRLSIS